MQVGVLALLAAENYWTQRKAQQSGITRAGINIYRPHISGLKFQGDHVPAGVQAEIGTKWLANLDGHLEIHLVIRVNPHDAPFAETVWRCFVTKGNGG